MNSTLNHNDLQLTVENNSGTLLVSFSGTASNDDEEFLRETLGEILRSNPNATSLIFNMVGLDFCYSGCIRVLTEFSTDSTNRPHLQYILKPTNAWQATSLRCLIGMSPACSILSTDTDSDYCPHSETGSFEDHFFAPTGNGSIKTTVFCKRCSQDLSVSWEYFN